LLREYGLHNVIAKTNRLLWFFKIRGTATW